MAGQTRKKSLKNVLEQQNNADHSRRFAPCFLPKHGQSQSNKLGKCFHENGLCEASRGPWAENFRLASTKWLLSRIFRSVSAFLWVSGADL